MSSIHRIKSKHASNNPYKQMNENSLLNEHVSKTDQDQQDDQQDFMSFAPKQKHTSHIDIPQRRYTQRKPPPNMNDFITEFEQEKSPETDLPKLERSNSIVVLANNIEDDDHFDMISFGDEENNQDFSDTARLTVNASSQSGFYQNRVKPVVEEEEEEIYKPRHSNQLKQQQRHSRLYEPAQIDPEIDQRTRKLNKIIHFDKSEALRQLSKTIRKLSKRVINLHDNNNDSSNNNPQPQQHQPTDQQQQAQSLNTQNTVTENDIESDTSSLIINEAIPMKQTFSNNSTKLLIDDIDTTHIITKSTPAASILPTTTATPNSAATTAHYVNPEKNDTREQVLLSGYSLKLLSPTNLLRRFLANILCWKWYETFIMLLLVLHAATLIAVGWGVDPNPSPPTQWGVSWEQYVLLVIFSFYTLTMLIRIVVYGVFLNPNNSKTAYLRHSWNRIDFVSIVSYWVDFALIYTQQEIIDDIGRRILVFKMLSALILLRLLNLTDGNRVILNSLKKAAPLLVNVLFFVLFFFVIFAITGVQSFKGSFKRHCVWHDPANATNTVEMSQYCGGYINATGYTVPYKLINGEDALWSKGFICENGLICEETENPFGGTISFDNIFESMLIVMIIAGVQSWTDRMYDMMDAEYFVASLYFVIIVIVMNFWLINLFIAVITEMFAKVREDSQHSAFTNSTAKPVLADGGNEEEGWAFTERDETLNGQKQKRAPLNLIVTYMKPFWILLVATDLFCMAAKNNNMTQQELDRLGTLETIFSLAFLFEILLRLLNERKDVMGFFKNRMNSTDFIIAIVTCIIQVPAIRDNTLVYIWFTGFQVLRIYRLVVAVPRLRSLMSRVLGSVYGLVNLTFFIILATLISSIIAFELLEGTIDSDTGEEMRFFSIYNSFAALYQLFSGENWTTVLYGAMEAGSTNNNSAIYALFLVFWFAFSNFVLVNMFVAVLMENFEIAENDKRKNQILQYMKKTENENDRKTVVSRWNIYRYFKSQPRGLDVTNIPSNLVLPVQKNIVREFMNEASDQPSTQQQEPRLVSSKDSLPPKEQNGVLKEIQNFLTQLFPDPAAANNKVADLQAQQKRMNNRTSMYIDPAGNAFDQVGTFYDFKNKAGEMNEPRSLRYLVDPTLRETVSSRFQQEITDHDIEERKALKRDFILAHPSYDKSLYIFSPGNRLRRWCQLIVQPSRGERTFGTPPDRWKSLIFLTIITCCVIANVVLTIYNSPVYQFENRYNQAAIKPFVYVDLAFAVIFTIEFVVKVIADGLILTPNAYMLNGWNLLDLFVLITLYLSNFVNFSGSTGLERGFRAFKALRALRLINLLGPAKETFSAILVTGLPRVLDAGALGLCLIVPFALYGQNVFMGLFYNCNDNNINGKSTCMNEAMNGMSDPQPGSANIYSPRVWQNPYQYSFDSFGSSLLILFEIASGEGWTDVLATSMRVVGKDQSTVQDASQLWGIFFMVYNLAGSVFVISLFLGVVIENFTKRNGTAYLTSDQRRWLDLKKLLNQFRPAKRPKTMPSNYIRKLCFNLTVEKRGRFYKFMTVIISLNILFLCTDTASESDGNDSTASGWGRFKVYIYLVFIVIYWLEIAIKLLGLGWKSFRRNLWNLFDLTVVIGSFITAIITLGNPNLQLNVESQKLFMTALCFKLVQRSDSLNQLFTTMAASAYQIVMVFAVWFVVLTTYCIMFMQIFGLTRYGPNALTEHVNFRYWGTTMISLIRYSTGEGWNTMMHDFTIEAPNCVVADNYLDSDCGSLRWSYFLFLTFNIISMYIFTAIFVAVVADNFSYVYQIQANFSLVNRDEIRKFKMTWAAIDTERTGYVAPNQYMTLWRKLEGIFTVRIFQPEYSYKNLVKECSTNVISEDPYEHHLDFKALNQKLSQLDKRELHTKRQDLEKIYWETALVESTIRGVSFNQMLLMLAQRKLIVPENALILEELLENQKKEEAIHTLISIDRVRGLIETIALRKKFLRHLSNIKKQKEVVPAIIIDNTEDILVTQPEEQGNNLTPISPRSYNGDSLVSSINYSHTDIYDHYLSSDDEGGERHEYHEEEEEEDEDELNPFNQTNEEEEDIIIEDVSSHDIWKEMLRDAHN